MNILNLTPHDIVVYDAQGKEQLHTFPASGQVARVSSGEQKQVGTVLGNLPVFETQQFGEIEWPQPSDAYCTADAVLVSMLVGQQCKSVGPGDNISSTLQVYGPDTSPQGAVRDASGRIVGTKRLVRYL